MARKLKLVEGTPDYEQHRDLLCRRWLAGACNIIRRRVQMATQIRQAISAGLTHEEAQLSVETTVSELERLQQVLQKVRADAESLQIELPIHTLVTQAHLDPIDQDILMLSLAPHIDVEIRDAIARFNDNLLANYVDVRLCLEFLSTDPIERLALRKRFSVGGNLLASRMVNLTRTRDASGDNLLGYEVNPAPRVMQLLLGELGLLDSAMEDMAKFERPAVTLDKVILSHDLLKPMLSLLTTFSEREALASNSPFALPRGLVMEISGPPGTGKSLLVRALANHIDTPLLELNADRLHEMSDDGFRRALQSGVDQARLGGAMLVLDKVDALLAKQSSRVGEVQVAMQRHSGVVMLVSHDSSALDSNLDRFVVQRLMLPTPNVEQREQLMRLHLPEGVTFARGCKVKELAGIYSFPGALIRNAMQVAVNRAFADTPTKPQITHDMLRKACHEQIRASLDEYAVRKQVHLSLKDLVLPQDTMEDIEELFTAAKFRAHVLHNWGFQQKMSTGKGLVALFSGEPGTGKTLCCTILANELDLQLFQISIPRVVSKWIGETEKNIEKIFETARANHGMLLFDEADSLFAKRTKVESSVDRYSNMATNMLLQEIENFEGIVVLTTNIEKNMDDAFKRRIQFKVHFPFPEPEMRAQIWKTLVPSSCPLEQDIDWPEVGKRYELSGGHIKNAVLRAAYQAAAENEAMNDKHIEYAARQECKNAGRVFRSTTGTDLF